MLEVALQQGFSMMVLTPYLYPVGGPDKEQGHRERFAEFTEAVREAGMGINIHLGSEIAFRFEYARSRRLAEGHDVLTDLPSGPISPGLEQAYFELRSDGYKPIQVHPERHRELSKHPEQIDRLRE